ncbi:Fe-S cluster assembly sulfur transfer protein SufU [Chthonomonas calidirosea]|uniref:Fe-S cluster assembly sulfur transfer protein SufU n=1 Tax=Chthonomonas calidirosea TaxID=454171 RepID=UPI0009491ECE
MDESLRELYQEIILEHNRNPRNFGALEGADFTASGHNPLCGDQVTVYLKMDGDYIKDIRFVGQGCAISKASASLMTTSLKGKTRGEAEAIFEAFHKMVTSDEDLDEQTMEKLGKLAVFAGVREFPTRVKCASLAWHTLRAALHQSNEIVRTE